MHAPNTRFTASHGGEALCTLSRDERLQARSNYGSLFSNAAEPGRFFE